MNEHCKCGIDSGGFCERHKITKTAREVEMCRGEANTPSCGRVYWLAWEQGSLGATKPAVPIMNPDGFCNRGLGFGDTVASTIKALTLGMVTPCGGCKGRQANLNHWFPSAMPPVEPIEFVEPVRRNFMMHIWPVKGYGAWQWNVDQVLKRAELFNGRRVVAIVTSGNADHPDVVKEAFRGFTDEFIVLPNNATLREVVTFLPMLEKLESTNPNEVTFCCHSKGVKHNVQVDYGGTIFRWTKAMYETCLDDWPTVLEQLRTKAMTGSFKRYGMFKTRGNHQWHYSGTFYWFRNADVFSRNWRFVDQKFFGVESWPGHMFKPEETGCLFGDNAGELYDLNYLNNSIEPALTQWKASHESIRV